MGPRQAVGAPHIGAKVAWECEGLWARVLRTLTQMVSKLDLSPLVF